MEVSKKPFCLVFGAGVVLASVACRKESPPPPVISATTRPRPSSAPVPPPEPAKPYVLDAAKLDRYIEYQRKVIAASRETLQNIAKIGADAGTFSALSQSSGALQEQGNAVNAALKESGLSKEDVHAIEPMVNDVTAELMASETVNQMNIIKMLEDQMQHVPPDARAQMEKTVKQIKDEQEARAKLTKEREKYGDANVDLLVSKKDALLQLFKDSMRILGGGSKTAKPQ